MNGTAPLALVPGTQQFTWLDLGGTAATHEGVSALRAARPTLRVDTGMVER